MLNKLSVYLGNFMHCSRAAPRRYKTRYRVEFHNRTELNMQAIFILCTVLVCAIVLLKLSWGGGSLDTQGITNSTTESLLQKKTYSSSKWFKDAIKYKAEDNELNSIPDQELATSKARHQRLLNILRRQQEQDILSEDSTFKSKDTEEPANTEYTTNNCDPILQDDCQPESIGPRLSAKLLKILA
ncbi:uncharacterized protein LOC108095760 [Drosophila ficusphila]|uniref:uncharacterized protein LOC108095760 n=1 Tax=Drosophila ficusphila TaxID=30025 RepID=UPI0007E5BFAA|nr:uncharacterized protein LOC108095760 [Drosophila ficusphila]